MDLYAQTWLTPPPILRTARLILRPVRIEDEDAVVDALNEPSVVNWLTTVPFPYAREDFTFFLDDICKDPSETIWALDHGKGLIGVVSVRPELGYWLHTKYHRQGYMTEAVRAAIDWYFSQLNEPIVSGYHVGNTASELLLRKLGFRNTFLDEEVKTAKGNRVDVQRLKLTREDWDSRYG